MGPSQWVGNFTLTETWRHHLFGRGRAHFVGQSWTLCYEEQFYAVVGLILLVARRHIFAAAVFDTALSTAAQIAAPRIGWSVRGFFFDGSWLMFASGILV
jgi:peptidoglycan/LPS O-acetylase OafA/YrhL